MAGAFASREEACYKIEWRCFEGHFEVIGVI